MNLRRLLKSKTAFHKVLKLILFLPGGVTSKGLGLTFHILNRNLYQSSRGNHSEVREIKGGREGVMLP